MSESLQERYAPASTCFGCGPANAQGLHIRSFVEGDAVVAEWRAEPHYEAFPGVLNGGIVGALLDCHSNWTAAHHLMRAAGADSLPSCVTAEYAVKMRTYNFPQDRLSDKRLDHNLSGLDRLLDGDLDDLLESLAQQDEAARLAGLEEGADDE